MSNPNRPERWPLTAAVFIEFVDAADPDDASMPPNFGALNTRCEPRLWHDDPRLPLLMRWLADSIEQDQRDALRDG